MSRISAHIRSLTRFLLKAMKSYSHPNGRSVVEMYLPLSLFPFAYSLKKNEYVYTFLDLWEQKRIFMASKIIIIKNYYLI